MTTNEISQLKRKADGLLESCLSQNKFDCILGFLEFQFAKNKDRSIEIIQHTKMNIMSEISDISASNQELIGNSAQVGQNQRLELLKNALDSINKIR